MLHSFARLLAMVLVGFLVGSGWGPAQPSPSTGPSAGLVSTATACAGESSQVLALVGRSGAAVTAAQVIGEYVVRPALGSQAHSTLAVVEASGGGQPSGGIAGSVAGLRGVGELLAHSGRSEYTSCKYDLSDKPMAASLAKAGQRALLDRGVMSVPAAQDSVVYLLSDDPTRADGFLLTVLDELPDQIGGRAFEVEIRADGSIGDLGPADWFKW